MTKIKYIVADGTKFNVNDREDFDDLCMKIHHRACDMCLSMPALEVRSAIKQAASDYGIPYGDLMGRCVEAVEKILLETC